MGGKRIIYYDRVVDAFWLLSDGDLVNCSSKKRIPQSQIDFTRLEKVCGVKAVAGDRNPTEKELIEFVKTYDRWIRENRLSKRTQ